MVRAILEGRKTMTRRVINPQPPEEFEAPYLDKDGRWKVCENNSPDVLRTYQLHCPYGVLGDHLWARETFANINKPGIKPEYIYRADPVEIDEYENDGGKWKPSIHMPRWASRITLEIVSLRVERLQDISEEDARAEGIKEKRWQDLKKCPMSLIGGIGSTLPSCPQYRYGFYELWDSINAKRGCSWESNPWVWVIKFKRILGKEVAK